MLMEQVAGAQAALESDIELLRHAAMMGGDGAALAAAQNQMSRLSGLAHRIEGAQGGGLAAIRAEVMASVAASQTLAQQARASVSTAHAAEAALHEASAAAHRVTGDFVHDFYERKIFDPYLRFASPEEERAYREREEARHHAVDEARAQGTPQGELRVIQIQQDQLRDAGAHGATDSPDYQHWTDRLETAKSDLKAVMPPVAEQGHAHRDTLDQVAPNATVDPEVLAALKAAGVVLADQSQEGHGVSLDRTVANPNIVRA